jgi:hypothetical protein
MSISGRLEKGRVRAERSSSNRNVPKRNTGNDAVVNGDMTALVRQQHVDVSHKSTKKVTPCAELPLDVNGLSSAGSERVHTMCMGYRSVGCQTVDPKNFNRLLNEGVIKYPGTNLWVSENSLLTCDIGLQTDMTPNLVSRINNTAGDTLIPCERNDLDMQNLSLSDQKKVFDEPQVKVNMFPHWQ